MLAHAVMSVSQITICFYNAMYRRHCGTLTLPILRRNLMSFAEPARSHPSHEKPLQPTWTHLTSIPTRHDWNGHISGIEYERALLNLGNQPQKPLSVYLHLPFCPVRCLYCGCNTIITHSTHQIDNYLDSLEREMDLVIDRIGADRELLQFHVGGGTPNYLNDSQLARLMEMVKQRFRLLGETEISIDCNPRKATAGQLSLLSAIGFRRVSFGVQDLDPEVQRAIGRINSAELVQDVCVMSRDAGFEYINLDLIYGLPFQTIESFRNTISSVIDMTPDRVTCFAFSHDPINKPHQHALDHSRLPSRRERLSLFQHAVSRLTDSGYNWTGLDTFVLDTDELAIAQEERRLGRNCIGYTGSPSCFLIAFGLGAVSDIDGVLVQNAENLSDWSKLISSERFPIAHSHCLDSVQRARREAMIQIICNLEIDKETAKTGLPREIERLHHYQEQGLINIDGDTIRLTTRGRYYLHSLCVEPDAHLQDDRAYWPLLQSI